MPKSAPVKPKPTALDIANARIAEQRETIKGHCIAAHELSAARDAANARADAAEREIDKANHVAEGWRNRARVAETEAAALRAEVEGLSHNWELAVSCGLKLAGERDAATAEVERLRAAWVSSRGEEPDVAENWAKRFAPSSERGVK